MAIREVVTKQIEVDAVAGARFASILVFMQVEGGVRVFAAKPNWRVTDKVADLGLYDAEALREAFGAL